MTGAAVVGCGLIGTKRALALTARGIPVLLVHDTDGDASARLAAALPAADVAADLDALLADPRVDLVVVATVHAALAGVALAAVRSGKHVLVEKPGGHHLAEIEALAKVAQEHDRHVRVGFNHRFHPSLRKARELVHAGGYGAVLHIRGRYGHGGRVGYEREWRADRAQSGGGELLDQGIHLIDLTRYLVGDVALAFCELRTEFWPMAVEDNAYLALRAEQGAFAWLHASWSEWKNLFSLEISMRDAKIEITGLGGSYGIERLTLHEMKPEMGPPDSTAWEWPGDDDSWQAEVDDVLAALAGEPTIGASLDDCVAAFAIVDEAYRDLPGAPAPRTRK